MYVLGGEATDTFPYIPVQTQTWNMTKHAFPRDNRERRNPSLLGISELPPSRTTVLTTQRNVDTSANTGTRKASN
jgi:hypothetical protein